MEKIEYDKSISPSNNKHNPWFKRSVITMYDDSLVNPSSLSLLLDISDALRFFHSDEKWRIHDKDGKLNQLMSPCKSRVLSCLFYEPSTRTQCSFTAAMFRLGGSSMQINTESSSVKKGETLEDTVRCLESYSDILVMRHPEKGSAEKAVKVLKKPLLNAGDGVGEHPTQALLDLYTIRCEMQRFFQSSSSGDANGSSDSKRTKSSSIDEIESLSVVLLGDLLHGRTVHSLIRLLPIGFRLLSKNLKKIEINLVSPAALKLPADIISQTKNVFGDNVVINEYSNLSQCIERADVLYVTRIQKERFKSEEDYMAVKGSFVVDAKLLEHAKKTLIVMHPLPRVDEISTDIDNDPRAAYFRQMEYGMYVRMALIGLVLGDFDVKGLTEAFAAYSSQ